MDCDPEVRKYLNHCFVVLLRGLEGLTLLKTEFVERFQALTELKRPIF
jgi:hypothetical protein